MADERNKDGGLLAEVRQRYERGGLDSIWKWCMAGEGAHAKAKRFGAAAEFAGNRKGRPRDGDGRNWRQLQEAYRDERDKWEERYESRTDLSWPAHGSFTELLYHNPGPHVHAASADRQFLIAIASIGQEKFGLRIGEFPPFDSVECVHVSGSWHYRIRRPDGTIIALPCSSPDLDKGGKGGLALDANDADGGSDQEYAFFIELRRRYA